MGAIRRKVVMIGIDAGDIDFIQASLDKLPHLRQLIAESPPIRLRSTAESLTASVWSTFSTGTLPGEHGLHYPMQWNPTTMRLRRVSADWLSQEPFWYELVRQGLGVTVLDAPFSLKGRMDQGTQVINWGSHECIGSYECSRPELTREIRRRFGRHPMGYDISVDEKPAQLERTRDNLVAGARVKGELSRWLLETTEWDFFLTIFGECHRGGHILWPAPVGEGSSPPPDALLEVYQAVDRAVGHVLDAVELNTTTVIVFSVHGMGANSTQDHFVRQVMDRINVEFTGEGTTPGNTPAKPRGFMRMLREALPAQLQLMLAKTVPVEVRDWVVERAYIGGLDWSRTPGFVLPAGGESFIRYNLVGREAAGMLEKGGELHQRYEQWLKESFFALKVAGTDAPLVKDIVSPAALYPGARSEYLPDLVVLWENLNPAAEIYSDRLGRFTGNLGTGRTGNHRPDGFAVLAGKQQPVEQVHRLRHIVDFAGFVQNLLMQTNPA